MFHKNIIKSKTSINVNDSYEAESLERKIERMISNKEDMDHSVPLTYTEKKNGVLPEYNIRTDKWEIATDAMDQIARVKAAKNAENPSLNGDNNVGGAEPVHGEAA